MVLPTGALHAGTAGCEQFSDCDTRIACELYETFQNAQSGMAQDFNTPTAQAIIENPSCTNYPDKFKNNIDATIENTKLAIDWNLVRDKIKNGINATGTTNGDADTITREELIELYINALGPDTKEQEAFFKDLATQYVSASHSNDQIMLDDAFVLNMLSEGNTLNKYKKPLSELTGEQDIEDLNIFLNWDDILLAVSNVLDTTSKTYGAMVCENNRSWEGMIDAVGWIVTAVAAIATFYSGGAGGAAVAAGRAALGAGLKQAAKAAAKVGAKKLATKISKQGSKQLAKSAVKIGMKKNMRGWATYTNKGNIKGLVKGASKHFVKKVKANLKNKWTKLAAAGAIIYQGANAGTGYSLLSSDLDKEIVNCQDLDHNEGCYTVCGDGAANDDLNAKVIKPATGRTACVGTDYHLYELNGTSKGKRFFFSAAEYKKMEPLIKSLKDTGKCDWNEDDIDMYIGSFIYDPDTLEVTTDAIIIENAFRLDD